MRQITNIQIRILAERLETGPKPILFLGAGCSKSAGLPGEAELIKQIGKKLCVEIDSLGELARILKDKNDLCLQIRQQLSAPKSIGAFEKLASLLSRGFFRTILTTNWDSLIETSLAHFLSPDRYKVYVRGEMSDQIIANALKQKHPMIKIVKLHGDVLSLPVIAPRFLMNIDDPLEQQINSMICDNGLVVVGYRLNEPRFTALLRNSKPIIVDPTPYEQTFLEQLGDGATQVAGQDGKFENFVNSLCDLLLAREYRDWFEYSKDNRDTDSITQVIVSDDKRKKVDEIVDRIRESIEASNVADERVKQLTRRMLRRIRKKFEDTIGNVCLVFVRDPSAPGGDEIERLIHSDPALRAETSGMDMAWVEMNNRVTDKGPRRVNSWGSYDNMKPVESLADNGAVVLVDSVAFPGHTLEIARDYLSSKSGRAKSEFTAAVLLLPPETKENLIEVGKWWDVISEGRDYTGFQVTFPWGWTTATRHVPQRAIEDAFIPGEGFAYTPKPWGDQLGLSVGKRSSVSLLLLERGQRTSTHYHLHRNETFVVLDNRLRVCIWDHYLELKKHESIRIPSGVPHSLIALDQPCRVLEIATGHYDVEKDIVRLVDIYGRRTRPDGSDDGLV